MEALFTIFGSDEVLTSTILTPAVPSQIMR
jgi:hypothetical protein